MNSTQLFTAAFGLQAPWQINQIELTDSDAEGKELHLQIGFDPSLITGCL